MAAIKSTHRSVCITNMPFYSAGDQYALKMRLVDHVYDDQVIDFLTVKIILPEGARSVFVIGASGEFSVYWMLMVSFALH